MRSPLLLALTASALADPQLSSWYTDRSATYARLYESTAAESAGVAVTSWSRGQGVQTSPTYAGLHQVSYSDDWVYIRSTGLATHIMGPWYLDAEKARDFPNFPSNTAVLYRIPRSPVIPTSKTTTNAGATGYYVNGVAMFDMQDTFSYSTSSGEDATPVNGIRGDGIWNREAFHNEGVTFDAGLAHQAMNQYHYHAQPPGLRHQLGDHVDYDSANNVYSESDGLPSSHSPIIAWAADGLPVYGPYGFADPLDPGSAIKRMIPGFRTRSIVNRTTLPTWVARMNNSSTTLASNEYGPTVSNAYAIGHYIEDYEYLGDLGQTQGEDFDLNEQNVRWCVTPEYPGGTWAYFLTIDAGGTPIFPFACGRQFYGSPTGGSQNSITESVTPHWNGGPLKEDRCASLEIDDTSGDVTLVWSAVEGGTYDITSGATPDADGHLVTTTLEGGEEFEVVESGAKKDHPKRFYRLERTSLATFDNNGFDETGDGSGGDGGSGGEGSDSFTFTFATTPPLPPDSGPVTATVSGLATTITNYDGPGGNLTLSFDASGLSAGNYTALLSFAPPGQDAVQLTSTNFFTVAP